MWSYYEEESNTLSHELFQNPTARFRGAPFWAWNTKLEEGLLLRELECFKEMGMGGFHIHSRTGLNTPYLGEKFMSLVKACNNKAKQEGMLTWLYDEDRWPSGSAGGAVTKNKKYRARHLLITPQLMDETYCSNKADFEEALHNNEQVKGYFLAKYQVQVKDGYLVAYKRLQEDEKADEEGKTWWAYLELQNETSWFNNQTYVNTLDQSAIQEFIKCTHEVYHKELGSEFGKSIPAIFTDEPQFSEKECFNYPNQEKHIVLPYTDDFDVTYHEVYKENILEHLPELLWQLPRNEVSLTRYHYHDHLSERFCEAFADTLGSWCQEHNILLTGHMMEEPSLYSQTKSLGEAMRSYRAFHLPGIDMLFDSREYTTAKQAQSAAHQYGRPGVISELYGVTNWDFDFKRHKLSGDWQAALGVTTRVHHLSWVSMGGESKRDFPATIGYQSPWYKEYSLIENHFSRLNTALTRGKPRVRVGVIHPIESYWLYWGPIEQTTEIREALETNFQNITQWLLFGLVDFDFIAESSLPSLYRKDESVTFHIGEMNYEVILIPECHTLRSSTVTYLEAFTKNGGTVVFVGQPAQYIDAILSERALQLSTKCKNIAYTKQQIIESVETVRDVDVHFVDGRRTDHLFYQMREEGINRWLFICHVNPTEKLDVLSQIFNKETNLLETIQVKVKGKWKCTVYNTMDGQTSSYPSQILEEETIFDYEFYGQDSLLLLLEPCEETKEYTELPKSEIYKSTLLDEPIGFSLSEPNVLLMDMAEYSLDDEEWLPEEEILKIDHIVRKRLGYHLRTDAIEQPWINGAEETSGHLLKLKYKIFSKVAVKNPMLAIENPETLIITYNNENVEAKVQGWYVDESIKKISLPDLRIGVNILCITMPFHSKTNLEWCYLLGNFGVAVQGRYTELCDFPNIILYGDWTRQGFPFYAGNLTYHCLIESDGSEMFVQIAKFHNPVLAVTLDGESMGQIAFEPNRISLGKVEKGIHKLDITAYGNRINAFGAVHNCVENYKWYGPNAWRTTGIDWAYQYQLKSMGILVTPQIIYME